MQPSATPTATPVGPWTGIEEPPYLACPAGEQILHTVEGHESLVRNQEPRSHDYPFTLTSPAKLLVITWVMEGHPEQGCVPGGNCQVQLHEEFTVAIDGVIFGEYFDQGDQHAWLLGGPWETTEVSAPGTHVLRMAHSGRGQGAQSVEYNLTLCAIPAATAPEVSVTPEPTGTPVVTSTPTASPEPTGTPVITSTPTASPEPTGTSVVTSTPTASPQPEPTGTPVVTSTPTASPEPTGTPISSSADARPEEKAGPGATP